MVLYKRINGFIFTIEPKDSFQKIIIVLQQETDKLGYNKKLNNSVLYMKLKEIVFNIGWSLSFCIFLRKQVIIWKSMTILPSLLYRA
jgi:hypothetical protein